MGNFNFVTLSANIPQCCFGINFVKRNIRFTVLMKRELRFFFVFVVFAERFFRFGAFSSCSERCATVCATVLLILIVMKCVMFGYESWKSSSTLGGNGMNIVELKTDCCIQWNMLSFQIQASRNILRCGNSASKQFCSSLIRQELNPHLPQQAPAMNVFFHWFE